MNSIRKRKHTSDLNEKSEFGQNTTIARQGATVNPLDDHKQLASTDSNDIQLSFWIGSFILLFVGALIVGTIRNTCVSNMTVETPGVAHFSGSNARIHLKQVTSLGPRTAGSIANEVAAPDYMRKELLKVVALAKKSGLEAAFQEQISGYSSFQAGFHVSAYQNLRNFVIKLSSSKNSKHKSARHAFLVNCHYDSAVESPGASDDFVSCAIMLEVSRVIAMGKCNLTNDLIFLFNGAEESILPSSHAFITQHPWAKEISAFLNLEGAGSGGRLTLFQSGPGAGAELLVSAYSDSFSQPYGSVFAEELFQSGFIPSDTDFRIFRDFGHIPGLDMAYTSDGYCYHTRFDTESRISDACLQKTGDDILSLILHIAKDTNLASLSKLRSLNTSLPAAYSYDQFLSSDDIDRSYRPSSKVETSLWNRRVYFDVLGVQLVSIPWKMWKSADWILLSLVLCWLLVDRRFQRGRWLGLFMALVLQLCGQLLGILFAYVLGYVTHHFGCRMSWYSARYNLIGVYLLPFVCLFFWFHTLFAKIPNGTCFRYFKPSEQFLKAEWLVRGKRNNRRLERDFFDSSLIVIAFHLLVLDLLNSPAVFVSTFWLSSVLFGRFVYHLLSPRSLNSIMWTICILLPTCVLWHFYFSFTVLEVFIPIFGRSGQAIKPDVIMSLGLFYMISPLTLLFSGMLQSTSRRTAKTLRILLLNSCLSYAVLVHASPYGFPYTVSLNHNVEDPSFSPRFQRIALFHTDRYFRDIADSENITSSDSYMLLIPLDVNSIRYLKPNSYPATIPSSFFSIFQQDGSKQKLDSYGGLVELVNASSVICDRSRPYCGTPSLYPYIHFFEEFYHIPTPFHSAKPNTRLRLLSRTPISKYPLPVGRKGVNLTFSVISGPPHTHLMIRTDPPMIRLSNWSFSSIAPFPVPVPLPRKDGYEGPTGAHYFIYHVNAKIMNATRNWDSPWTFWLGLDFESEDKELYIDVALSGIYIDDKTEAGSSPQLEDISSRLPPWVTTMSGCTSYQHYRFRLN